MNSKYILFLLSLLIITGISASLKPSQIITIENSVDMRSGPGSYYPLTLRLKPGAEVSKIDQQQQWLKVKAEDHTGWIPERSTYQKQKSQRKSPDLDEIMPNARDAFDELAAEEADTTGDPYASPAQVAAAVKGFTKNFTAQKNGNSKTQLLQNFNSFVDPAKYRQFQQVRLEDWSWQKAQDRFPLETNKVSGINPLRQKTGWAIANVIAQQGLIQNQELQQYLTHIALILAENSHRYETPAQVYILDTNEINGYAAPNGAIFVSKGALQLMENESEFAFFIAHELVHVVLNHGIKETEQRKARITADQRFQELNRELENRKQKYEGTEENLTQWANQVYEYTVRDRLKEYEYEADYWGVAYTYRTGYDPAEGLNLLRRIFNKEGDVKNKIGLTKWKGASLRNRIIKIDNQIDELDIPNNFGDNYQPIFQQKLRNLEK